MGMSAGCGQKTDNAAASQTVKEQMAADESTEAAKEENTKEDNKKEDAQVAQDAETEKETAPTVQVVEDGMVPVEADALKDGVYSVEVDSSSSMFHITEAELTVAEGKMTVRMTLSGSGYGKVFMGTGEEAEKAAEEVINSKKYSLFSDYRNLFSRDHENNQEVIFDVQYLYPTFVHSGNGLDVVLRQFNSIAPTLDLVKAYDMKDGSSYTDGKDLYIDRDPRFYI